LKLGNRGNGSQRLLPQAVLVEFFAQDVLCFDHFATALGGVAVHDSLEVVDVVGFDAWHVAAVRVDVARHANVDKLDGAGAVAALERSG
jgi:hypothetical protein